MKTKDLKCFCEICGNSILFSEKSYKIKKKHIYSDYDGFWYNWSYVEICKDCMNRIKKSIDNKRRVNKDGNK